MKLKQFIIRVVIIPTLLLSIQNCVAGAKSGMLTITGTVRVVGNEPLTHIVLRTSDAEDRRDYLIRGPLEQELRKNFQGKVVTLEGTECRSRTPQFSKCFKPAKIIVE